MKELMNQVIKYDDIKDYASLELNLTGNKEAIKFIYDVLECLIDSCHKTWENKIFYQRSKYCRCDIPDYRRDF